MVIVVLQSQEPLMQLLEWSAMILLSSTISEPGTEFQNPVKVYVPVYVIHRVLLLLFISNSYCTVLYCWKLFLGLLGIRCENMRKLVSLTVSLPTK